MITADLIAGQPVVPGILPVSLMSRSPSNSHAEAVVPTAVFHTQQACGVSPRGR